MANRTTLKAQFSAGQSIVESDFTSLIDSLAHLTDDVASGALASGADIVLLNESIASLQALANSTKSDLDGYMGSHPTLAEVQVADSNLSNTLNASITALASSSQISDTALQSSITSLQDEFNALEENLNAKWVIADQAISIVPTTYATIVDLNTREANLETLANSKASLIHEHPEYATVSSISNFITLDDIPSYAPAVHQHTASDISGLDDLFMTPSETLTMIQDNSNTLDQVSQLYDIFYDKAEVDQKFIVARWRTDQVSLFNPSVVSISQPLVDLAKQDLEVSIAEVRVSLFADKVSILSDLAASRAEINVSINTLQSTIAQNKFDASVSLGNVNTQMLSLTTANANAITQAEIDANTYTDTKIDGLLNGAGDAYNTLKELQDHIVSNESSAALALTSQITTLDNALSAVDTSMQSSINSVSATVNSHATAIQVLQSSYNDLQTRLTALENTAYAQAGYTFP